jgi:hypothetical protein
MDVTLCEILREFCYANFCWFSGISYWKFLFAVSAASTQRSNDLARLLVEHNIFPRGMKGEFFYANAGFSEVFYGLNPNRVSENVFFQYIVRSSFHGWHLLLVLEFSPESQNSHDEDRLHSAFKFHSNGTPTVMSLILKSFR